MDSGNTGALMSIFLFTLALLSLYCRCLLTQSATYCLPEPARFTRPLLGAIQPYVVCQPAFRATNPRLTHTVSPGCLICPI
jgi:hypothetical protein